MARYLFLAFVVVPIVELYLLIGIGRQLGAGPTLGLVLASGLLGGWLARREGKRVMRNWRNARQEGRVPEEGLVSGALVLAGGLLLIIPGVLTDVVGLFLLVPPARRWVSGRLRRALERRMKDGTVQVTTFGGVTFHREGASPPPGAMRGEAQGEGASAAPRKALGEVDADFTDEKPRN